MAGLLCLLSATAGAAETPEQLAARVDRGDFAGARSQIDAALQQPALGQAQRDAYLFQRERMRRMQLDFGLDRERAMAAVRRYIPDLREDEFRAWDEAGLIEHLDIDGQRRWFNRAPSNLFRVSTAAVANITSACAPGSSWT